MEGRGGVVGELGGDLEEHLLVDLEEGEADPGLPLNCVDSTGTNGEQILCGQTLSFAPDDMDCFH